MIQVLPLRAVEVLSLDQPPLPLQLSTGWQTLVCMMQQREQLPSLLVLY